MNIYTTVLYMLTPSSPGRNSDDIDNFDMSGGFETAVNEQQRKTKIKYKTTELLQSSF